MLPATFCRAAWAGIRPRATPRHVFVCVADHFEPDWHQAQRSQQIERVSRWIDGYERLFGPIVDSRGRSPQHTFFYPMEVYDPEHVDRLCGLVRKGLGDIEVHLHHDNDDSCHTRDRLESYRTILHDAHGMLSRDGTGAIRYGFIHGNWALDNSDPSGRHCGVNDELSILIQTGCYADFTMPAAPHPAQTQTINQIYYASDDPLAPKSHDRGIRATVGESPHADRLLLVQGPLLLTMEQRDWVPRVRLENGNLSASQPPSSHRIRSWLRAGVSVAGRPEWTFIKLHTHGAQEENMRVLLGEPMQSMYRAFGALSAQRGFRYYFVTAREMAQLVHQAEAGLESPNFDTLGWHT